MHVGASFQNLLPLIFGPNHKSIHRSFDMLSRVSLSLRLSDDFRAVTFRVLILLLPLLLRVQRTVLGARPGADGGQGGEGWLGHAGRLEPGGVLQEVQIW